ncbi:uncharacterized protein LOC133826279 [Humulus lupulus]|uniref:uncharacterized protein LOC133826279 n=1 Tax=Humulus lupulus TaxID=3486 RepID=UPI002B41671D|nr:uncharacterized protein LOC133826279 [Humulus lupulus]
MDKIMLFVVFNGRWNANNKYIDHEVKILMVEKDIKYEELVNKIYKELRLNERLISTNLIFHANMDTSKGMKIESDENLQVYLNLNKTVEELKKCPLIVEVEQRNQTISLPREASIPSALASNATSQSLTLTDPNTNTASTSKMKSASTQESNKFTEHGQEAQSPLHVLPNMEIEYIRLNYVFKNKTDLKHTLAKIAIKKHFQYRIQKSCSEAFWAKCIDENCGWYVRARSSKVSDYFRVIKYHKHHTCSLNHRNFENRQASAKVISSYFKEKFRDPGSTYRPRQIIRDMRDEHGVGVTYNKAWRAKTLAADDVRGSNEESYALLPSYLYMLQLANPGTITRVCKDEENRFKYMFIAFGASLDGWKQCRPVIVVDGTFLKMKCGGTLYAACVKDGNNQIFPLAFGIGDSENDNAWIWFFTRLKEAIGERENLCIVSDRHKSIKNAVEQVYPGVYHGVCLYHLKQNLRTKFRGLHVHAIFEPASRAYSAQEYYSAMAELQKISPEMTTYLLEAKPEKWARPFFPTKRYNILTSNIAESINAAIVHARELPITSLIEAIREMLQRWFSTRKEAAINQFVEVTKWANDEMEIKLDVAFRMKVDAIDAMKSSVTYGDRVFVVDLEQHMCTCNEFQLEGIPCAHAIATIESKYLDKYKFCSNWYKNSVLKETYVGSINPIPDKDDWSVPDEIIGDSMKAPKFKSKDYKDAMLYIFVALWTCG